MDYSGESRLLMECREAIFVDKSAIDFLIFLLFFSKKFPIFPIFSIRSFQCYKTIKKQENKPS